MESGKEEENNPNKKKWKLGEEDELRFQVKSNQTIKLRLVQGNAECFGTELAKGRAYSYTDCSSCVFSWKGCVIEIDGECHAYIADETPMVTYLNTHEILQQRREKARVSGGAGPSVMIVGSSDAGKSSLCTLLCNYAARLGEQVTFIDLDIGQGCITLPGNVAAIPVERPIDIEEGFGRAVPIAYFYGNITPQQNPKLYTQQMNRLATAVNKKSEVNASARASGKIINTMGWVDDMGYKLLLDAVDAFRPDIILVIAHARLYNDLRIDLENKYPDMQIEKLPKSDGVVTRDVDARRKARTNRIKEYFYGKLGDLCPYSTLIPFHAFRVFKTNVGPQAPSSALPIGFQSTVDPMKPREITPSSDMLHSVVGVSYASEADNLMSTNLAGFLYVQELNLEKKTITALAPCFGSIPGKFLLLGNLKYLVE